MQNYCTIYCTFDPIKGSLEQIYLHIYVLILYSTVYTILIWSMLEFQINLTFNILICWKWGNLKPHFNKQFLLVLTNPSIYLHLIFAILQFEICIQFDELDFLSIWNLNFTGYNRQKNLVQTRKKVQFIKLDISNWRIGKIQWIWFW